MKWTVYGVLMLVTAATLSPAAAQAPVTRSVSRRTVDRLHESGWWPTKGDPSRKSYAGTEVCGSCHRQYVVDQAGTSMAKAASRAGDTETLRANPKLSSVSLPFLTTITRDRKGSTYTTSRGGEAMSGQIAWTMGDGTLGQTFILDSGQGLYESQLSYFPSIHGLDLTPGHLPAAVRDLETAFGLRQSEATARQCFACHTTGSTTQGSFDPGKAVAGVACESCHGPGVQHVRAMSQRQLAEGKAAILNPAAFEPEKLVDYCGACHRAPMDVIAAKDFVPINVRFQPYRLAKSRCWSQPDPRISCTACHNPHQQVVHDQSSYDAKCLACHEQRAESANSAQPAALQQGTPPAKKLPACPVSRDRCTSCHMPKYQVPQMHGSFTDHDIRVVRPGDPYPL